MTVINDRTTLKTYFENGDKPDETQFEKLIDASVGKIVVPLAYSSSLVTDLTAGYVFTVTVEGDMEISNPTGGINGNSYVWRIKQDGVGGHAITLGAKFKLPSSASTPLGWSTAAGAMDIFVTQYDSDADLFYVLSLIPGY
jgi:hypothetical protein